VLVAIRPVIGLGVVVVAPVCGLLSVCVLQNPVPVSGFCLELSMLLKSALHHAGRHPGRHGVLPSRASCLQAIMRTAYDGTYAPLAS